MSPHTWGIDQSRGVSPRSCVRHEYSDLRSDRADTARLCLVLAVAAVSFLTEHALHFLKVCYARADKLVSGGADACKPGLFLED